MCNRFVLLQQQYREVLERLGIPAPAAFISRYNIAPTSFISVVRRGPDEARESVAMHWGLIPAWAKDATGGARCANARGETLAEKPSFRDAWRRRRCVIPAGGFIEWTHAGTKRLPWLFERADGRPFCFAGLWDRWPQPDGQVLESCTIVTTTPNAVMAPIHDRMPVVLNDAECARWLEPSDPPPADLVRPSPAADWQPRRITQYANSVRHEGPACLAPPSPDESAGDTMELGIGY